MAQDNNANKNRNWPPKDPPMFWATFAAFIAVCVYAYFAWEQVQETHEANRIANNAFFAANRPYVMLVGYVPNMISELPGKREWRISAEVHNFGKTPAIDSTGKICDPKITQSVSPPSFNECKISELVQTAGIIGPDQFTNITGPTITEQDFEEIMRGQKLLYIYGDLRYRDNVTHDVWATRFCHQIKISLRELPTHEIATRVSMVGCGDRNWNCVDKDCPPPP